MKILAFGIVKEIFGSAMADIDLAEGVTIDDLKTLLEQKYPRLSQLGSYLVAVNKEYASPGIIINERDEVAIIPPVSGG